MKDDYNKIDYGWGIVVNFTKKVINLKQSKKKLDNIENGKQQVIIDVLLYLDWKINSKNQIQPCDPKDWKGILGIVPVTLGTVTQLSKVQMKMIPNLKDKKNIEKLQTFYYALLERFSYEPPILDPV